MPKSIKVSYFDIPGGRGEPTRLALTLGEIPFEDHRFTFKDWPKFREEAPFNACPYMEVDGHKIAQSNTMTRYAGKLAGLYPEDPWQAALCDEVLDAVEDMWVKLGPSMRMEDPEELKKARIELAEGPYTRYLQQFDARLEAAGGEYFADGRLTVADLQALMITNAIASGNFDHIPKDLVKQVSPAVHQHRLRMLSHPKIQEHYAKFAKG